MGFNEHQKPSLAVWIITLGAGESVTKDDFETCSKAVDRSCVPKHSYLKGEIAWRYIVGCLLPQMVMRRRRIPRNKWTFFKTKQVEGSGKPYIALVRMPRLRIKQDKSDLSLSYLSELRYS